jgi:hypothetical protein
MICTAERYGSLVDDDVDMPSDDGGLMGRRRALVASITSARYM